MARLYVTFDNKGWDRISLERILYYIDKLPIPLTAFPKRAAELLNDPELNGNVKKKSEFLGLMRPVFVEYYNARYDPNRKVSEPEEEQMSEGPRCATLLELSDVEKWTQVELHEIRGRIQDTNDDVKEHGQELEVQRKTDEDLRIRVDNNARDNSDLDSRNIIQGERIAVLENKLPLLSNRLDDTETEIEINSQAIDNLEDENTKKENGMNQEVSKQEDKQTSLLVKWITLAVAGLTLLCVLAMFFLGMGRYVERQSDRLISAAATSKVGVNDGTSNQKTDLSGEGVTDDSQVGEVEPAKEIAPQDSSVTTDNQVDGEYFGGGQPGSSVSGVPGVSTDVLVSQDPDDYGNRFVNTIGLGSQMMIAEPGTILVGPDFHDPEMINSSPHMDWISPITQNKFTNPKEEYDNVAEGAFLWLTAAQVKAYVNGITVDLESAEGHNWFLMVRGLFEDGKQDLDRNSTIRFTNYFPGHAQAMLYPPGAFISEGNFKQVAELSHTGGRNCGNEGCSGLSVLMLDLNTGAWLVIHQPQLDAAWEYVDSNWYQP